MHSNTNLLEQTQEHHRKQNREEKKTLAKRKKGKERRNNSESREQAPHLHLHLDVDSNFSLFFFLRHFHGLNRRPNALNLLLFRSNGGVLEPELRLLERMVAPFCFFVAGKGGKGKRKKRPAIEYGMQWGKKEKIASHTDSRVIHYFSSALLNGYICSS